MSILSENQDTLARLYNDFPESLKDLRIEGNFLVWNGLKTDISQFKINRLVNENEDFTASLSVLSSEDIFKIIRLHSEMIITSQLELDANVRDNDNQKKINEIKSENPLMKNISISSRNNNGKKEEFITIVDNMGIIHTFKNDYNVNILALYELLKFRHPGQDVSPDELIQEVNRKLYEIKLDKAESFNNRDGISEDFKNKIETVNKPYKDDKMHSVLGNQENDIVVINDLQDGTQSKLVTFNSDEFGNLVVESHSSNESNVDTGLETEKIRQQNTNRQIEARLISTKEFYDLLDSPFELSQEQRNSVNLYYAYLGDLITYEDYLLDELRSILNSFRAYVNELQNRKNQDENKQINNKQQEAIDKSVELEEKKNEVSQAVEYNQVNENVKKLVYINPNVKQYDNAASASIIQVIAFVIGIAIIMTAITLFLLG